MYQRILVTLDGSPTGDLALTEAVHLARAHGATLRIAHVIDAAGFDVATDHVAFQAFRDARAQAGQEVLAEATAFARRAGVRVETRLLETGRPDQRVAEVLAEEAKAWPAELVVMGTWGRRGCDRMRIGSVADGYLRVAAEPVLLVHVERPA